MSSEQEKLASNIENCSTVLSDVAGTTTSTKFVKDELFSFIKNNVGDFLKNNWDKEGVKNAVTELQEDVDLEKAIEAVKELTEQNSTNKGLKQLQGFIAKSGYESGALKGHIFSDVKTSFEDWTKSKKIAIYSTGDVESQKLLFANTVEGDISVFINHYFDQSVGLKTESGSFKKIAEELKVKTEEILFLTDNVEEAKAARLASLIVAVVEREGNDPLPKDITDTFMKIKSFTDLNFAPKRKICEETEAEEPPAKIARISEDTSAKEKGAVTAVEEKTANGTSEEEPMVVDEIEAETSEDQHKEEKMETDSKVEEIKKDTDISDKNEIKADESIQETKGEKLKQETEVEEPKQETQVDEVKEETKVDGSKQEIMVEELKQEAKVEVPKEETKVEELRQETKAEEPKQETKVEEPKQESDNCKKSETEEKNDDNSEKQECKLQVSKENETSEKKEIKSEESMKDDESEKQESKLEESKPDGDASKLENKLEESKPDGEANKLESKFEDSKGHEETCAKQESDVEKINQNGDSCEEKKCEEDTKGTTNENIKNAKENLVEEIKVIEPKTDPVQDKAASSDMIEENVDSVEKEEEKSESKTETPIETNDKKGDDLEEKVSNELIDSVEVETKEDDNKKPADGMEKIEKETIHVEIKPTNSETESANAENETATASDDVDEKKVTGVVDEKENKKDLANGISNGDEAGKCSEETTKTEEKQIEKTDEADVKVKKLEAKIAESEAICVVEN